MKQTPKTFSLQSYKTEKKQILTAGELETETDWHNWSITKTDAD